MASYQVDVIDVSLHWYFSKIQLRESAFQNKFSVEKEQKWRENLQVSRANGIILTQKKNLHLAWDTWQHAVFWGAKWGAALH